MGLIVENIWKSYKDKPVLKGFCAEIADPGVTVFMGKSGCGKTTLLRILAGLEKADRGQMGLSPGIKVSMVFQEDRLLMHRSGLENVNFVLKNLDGTGERLMSAAGLFEDMHSPVHSYSGGMRRRVALVRALAFPADLFLMDEPFKGLDQETREQIMNLCRTELKGKSWVFTTHDQQEALYLGAHIYEM